MGAWHKDGVSRAQAALSTWATDQFHYPNLTPPQGGVLFLWG